MFHFFCFDGFPAFIMFEDVSSCFKRPMLFVPKNKELFTIHSTNDHISNIHSTNNLLYLYLFIYCVYLYIYISQCFLFLKTKSYLPYKVQMILYLNIHSTNSLLHLYIFIYCVYLYIYINENGNIPPPSA